MSTGSDVEANLFGSRIRTDGMKADEYNRYNGCIKKKSYSNERAALKVAQRMFDQLGGAWNVYECPYCFQFHVGSVSGKHMPQERLREGIYRSR